MPDREEKHSILASRHADLKEQGLYAALEDLKSLSSSTLPLENIAAQITLSTRFALKVPCTALWLMDDLHKFISLVSFSCVDSTDTDPKKYNISLEDETSPVSECLRDGKPSLHKKQILSEMDPRAASLNKDYVIAVLPLQTLFGTIGVFEILTNSNDAVSHAELESLELLTAQIALLLSNHLNSDHNARQSALQKQLYEISAKINQAKDYESVLKITVEELCTALNLPAASMHVNMAVIGASPSENKEQNT
ncbi:MAG: GAF domain-containing protein [Anaerolineaceae bacterium]